VKVSGIWFLLCEERRDIWAAAPERCRSVGRQYLAQQALGLVTLVLVEVGTQARLAGAPDPLERVWAG
jgi:hypothetical protein